ncbi:uncharacterized protein [Antedon mediterranea]|uniref:uncharacterized protein isoform X2 n=1 Tax=Antedon mediterranea TaxID=105859 RepID=UPI003AF79890
MADDRVMEPDVPSQTSTCPDDEDDDSFSAESELADAEPLKGRRLDGKGKKKERGYKTFEEDETSTDGGTPDKAKLTKKSSFFRIGFQKPKVKEKDKEKQKEKQKPKAKDRSKEKEKERKVSKSKEGGRSRSKSKDNKDTKIKKQSSTAGLESQSTEPVEPRPVFGVDLVLAVDRSNPHDGIQLPLIVRDCIDYIEANGMYVEGIYRLSGVKSRIDALRTAYDTAGEDVDLTDQDPHIVAGLLKLFLRELPEPLLTQRIMLSLEEASKIPDNKVKIQKFRGAINLLPVCNRTLLSWVIVHMAHVIGNEIETKMNLQNISIVLCPTLHISHRVLNVFFTFWRDIFGDVVLKKVKRRLRWRSSRTSLELPDSSLILEEELNKQEAILSEMHERVNKGTADKNTEEQLWEVQRIVTQLKRKIRVCRKTSETAIAPTLEEEEKPETEDEKPVVEEDKPVFEEEKPVLEKEKPAVEEKSADDKAEDSVFLDAVPAVADITEQKAPEAKEIEGKVEEPIKEESEVKPQRKESDQDVMETVSTKKEIVDESVDKVVIEKENEVEKQVEVKQNEQIQEREVNKVKNVENIAEDSVQGVKEKEDKEEEKQTIGEVDNQQVKDSTEEVFKEDEEDDEEVIQLLLITQAEAMARQQELKKIQSELQERIEAERNDIERLRQKLAEEERRESLQLRPSSFESGNSSDSSNSSSSESEDEDTLMEILTKLTEENEKLEAKNNELVTSIHLERERCVDLRVKMTTMILKEDLQKRRSFSGPAPLETDL